MSESWSWECRDSSGVALDGVAGGRFPTQADAEAWFSQMWEELGEQGVASVTLYRDGTAVYGPMSLDPA